MHLLFFSRKGKPMAEEMSGLVAIFVPTVKKNGTLIPPELQQQWLNYVKIAFCHRFGGCTRIKGFGGWVSSEKLVEECVDIVFSFHKPSACGGHYAAEVRSLADDIKRNLSQECVAIVIDGIMEFV